MAQIVYTMVLTASYDPTDHLFREGLTPRQWAELDKEALADDPNNFLSYFPDATIDVHAEVVD